LFDPNKKFNDQVSVTRDIPLPGGLYREPDMSNGPDMNQFGYEPMFIHSNPEHQFTAVAWVDGKKKCRVGVLNNDDSGFAWTSQQLAGPCKGLHVRDDGVVAVLEATIPTDEAYKKQETRWEKHRILKLIIFDKGGQEDKRTEVMLGQQWTSSWSLALPNAPIRYLAIFKAAKHVRRLLGHWLSYDSMVPRSSRRMSGIRRCELNANSVQGRGSLAWFT